MGMFTEMCDECVRRIEWVLASDRLPEQYKPVLVAGGAAYLDGRGLWRTYMEKCSVIDGDCLVLNWTPKYWAPLPQPPE